jgi:hypothetical protein
VRILLQAVMLLFLALVVLACLAPVFLLMTGNTHLLLLLF